MPLLLIIILILSGIGMLNTLYLSAHFFSKKPVKCIFFPPEWCQKVQFSKYSKTLGIPNAFTGFGMYAAIAVLTILFWQGTISFLPISILIVVGFLFSSYFLYIQGAVLKAYCTWCVLSAIDFILLLLAIILLPA